MPSFIGLVSLGILATTANNTSLLQGASSYRAVSPIVHSTDSSFPKTLLSADSSHQTVNSSEKSSEKPEDSVNNINLPEEECRTWISWPIKIYRENPKWMHEEGRYSCFETDSTGNPIHLDPPPAEQIHSDSEPPEG